MPNPKPEIVREIRKQIKGGCDWIKVHVTGLPVRRTKRHNPGEIQSWTLDELRLVCDTAHALGVPVVGHCRNSSSTRDAALAGFDLIFHSSYMEEDALEAVVNHKTPLAPSFTFLKNLIDYGDKIGSDPGLRNIFMNEIEATSAMIRRAYDAGVPLMCGSESGFSVTPEFMIAEGNKVFAKCKATADGMDTIFGHYFEVTDGKMSMFMAFDDTLSSFNAMKK